MRRLLLLALVAAGLSPGLLWRDDPPPPNASQSMTFTALPFPAGTRVGGPGGPLLNGAWQMRSADTDFDSWSALVPLDRYNLLSISDRGHFLRFPVPGTPKGAGGPVAIGRVLPGSDQFKTMQDMESATRDPASGRIAVFVDGATTPALEANDTTLKDGRVGLGSFDETGQFRNVVVTGF